MGNKILSWSILLTLLCVITTGYTQQKKWRTYDEYNSRYPGSHALALYVDNKGLLWIGTRGTGVVTFDGKNWINYTRKNGLAGNVVHAIAQSAKGMWFGTFSNGVSFYDGETWLNFDSGGGLANNFVRAIAVEGDNIWFATAGGVSLFEAKKGKWKKYTTEGESELLNREWRLKRPYATIEGPPLSEIWDIIITSAGDMWIGTYNGIAKFNNVNWTSMRPPEFPMSDNEIKCLAVDSDGGLWIGTHTGGLLHFIDQKWTVYGVKDGLAHSEVTAITITDNSVWVGTNGSGISRYNGKNSWTTYTTADGLNSNFISALTSDGSKVWAGFYGKGISVFEEKNK